MNQPEITNEDLAEKIHQAEKKVLAYQQISNGHAILATLPENLTDGSAKRHHQKHTIAGASERQAAEELRQLHVIRAERGL